MKQGVHCGICKGKLAFKDHKQALPVGCKAELTDAEGKTNPELHAWLLSIKDKAEAENYEGFAFVREGAQDGEA